MSDSDREKPLDANDVMRFAGIGVAYSLPSLLLVFLVDAMDWSFLTGLAIAVVVGAGYGFATRAAAKWARRRRSTMDTADPP